MSRLRPPRGLVAHAFEICGKPFVVLSFPVHVDAPTDSLTEAERAVIAGILQGKTNAQIAKDRGRAVRTIANQIASAFRKLSVRSRSELAAALALDDS
jgi:DNA-binding NarL/FixJ family response regulator